MASAACGDSEPTNPSADGGQDAAQDVTSDAAFDAEVGDSDGSDAGVDAEGDTDVIGGDTGDLDVPGDASPDTVADADAGPVGESIEGTVHHSDWGPDETWDTSDCGNSPGDDTISRVDWQELDDEGRVIRFGISSDPGADGIWLTDDDTFLVGGGGAIAWEYTSATRYIERHTVALGDDGIPFTADDVIGFGRIRDIDENGGLRFDATLDGPGADGVWGTGDDELDDYTTRTFDRSGNLRTMVSYDGPGADGLWFTADDVVEFSGTYAQTPFAEVWRVAG